MKVGGNRIHRETKASNLRLGLRKMVKKKKIKEAEGRWGGKKKGLPQKTSQQEWKKNKERLSKNKSLLQ